MNLLKLLGFLAVICFSMAAQSQVDIKFIGDSITEGHVSGPAGPGYVQQLQKMLKNQYLVKNRGISGRTTRDFHPLAPEFDQPSIFNQQRLLNNKVFIQDKANVVFIMLGTNDSVGFMQPKPVSPYEYARNLRAIIQHQLQDVGVDHIYLVTPLRRPDGHQVGNGRIRAYHRQLKVLAREFSQVSMGPSMYHLLQLSDYAPGDIHPNVRGHRKMAQFLAGFIQKQGLRARACLRLFQ